MYIVGDAMWVGVTGGGEFGVRKEFCGLDMGEREPRSDEGD